jgi:hypothetical protein
MAATVAAASSRKRGFSVADILDDPFPLPSHHLAKRGRCSSSAASAADLGVSLEFDPNEVLQLIFPHEDPQVLQDSSIDLCLPSVLFFLVALFFLSFFTIG